ncbi:hypothetical protein CRG98_000363 [Punica granatum]|uniref:Importin N-terminal domain-containing protein n=1 Tax=Punica granatum TaxID=22663 RepID=A0A2I0LF11_PUNGR|nr:hypothetical protein CRG98_000363 [Punica granatum]
MDLQIKVAQAVHVLNHDTQSCNRVAANQWLVQFQQTDAAWEVATSILTSDRPLSPDFELEFFAAQILKRKEELRNAIFFVGVECRARRRYLEVKHNERLNGSFEFSASSINGIPLSISLSIDDRML